jgi:phosphatidylinositol glycan class B
VSFASVSSRVQALWGPLQQRDGSLPSGHRPFLIAILLAVFALRLASGLALPNINHADEVYQVAEQAHRAALGYGIEPWEFRTASRTVLLPTLVEPIYRLDVSATARRVLHAMLFCALSLIPVWVGFHWGGRLYGLTGAVLCAAIVGIWFELVYFAPKATADAVSGYGLLLGVYLSRPGAPARAVFGAGLSLGLTLALRVQIAPAVGLALVLAWTAGRRARTGWLAGGVAVGLLVAGLTEWRWWGVPFQGQIGYLVMEFTQRSSTYFSQDPFTFYIKQYLLMYGAATPVIAYLVYRGTWAAPVLLLVALAVIVPFHFVGHKEYRFIIAAAPLLVLLMGLGTSELMVRFAGAWNPVAVAVTIAGWLIGMVAVSWGDTYRPLWTRSGNHVLAFEEVGRQPDACGIALVGMRWWHTPGYSGLGADVPIYESATVEDEARLLGAANYVLQATKAEPPPPPYVEWRAFTRPVQYLYRRPGGCVPFPDAQVRRPPGIPGLE